MWNVVIVMGLVIVFASNAMSTELRSSRNIYVEPIAVRIFANFLYEGFSTKNRFISAIAVDEPVYEYKELTVWNASERSTSPENFDVYAVVENKSPNTHGPLTVFFDVYEKIGPISGGFDKARWLEKPFRHSVKVEKIMPNEIRIVAFKNYKLPSRYHPPDGDWVFEIRVNTLVSCAMCDDKIVLERGFRLFPGD